MGCSSGKQQSVSVHDNQLIYPQIRNKFKVVLLGKSGVGKTSISLRFVQDQFQPNMEPTVGAQFLTKKILIRDREIKFEIWDTAGQERFRALGPIYYRNADAAIIVYDITDVDSFEQMKTWHEELERTVPTCSVILTGNKLDMEKTRAVSQDVVAKYAQDTGCGYLEVSAYNGESIVELFGQVGKILVDKTSVNAAPTSKR
eukprot:TRINITY_DN7211_c0_g1_i1.p1 TRINITY_DN7211_c0_g1~~TRINITY_DN7211_c0_g1_i1.p1  ORF type:complete len:201 (-),score=36.14 TRINITY_DN7211_c0_g1_i1:59-661(-)